MVELKKDEYGRNIVLVSPSDYIVTERYYPGEVPCGGDYNYKFFLFIERYDDVGRTVLSGELIDYIAKLQERQNRVTVLNTLRLPFQIGQIAYTITKKNGVWKLDKGKIVGVEEINSYDGKSFCAIISKKAPNGETLKFYWAIGFYGEAWTTDKEAITKEFLKLKEKF